MTDVEFWSLIDGSRAKAPHDSRQQEAVQRQFLQEVSKDDIAEFSIRYDNLIRKAYNWELWGAAYIIGGGCSDGGFWDFRSWLVSRGKTVYEASLKDPESLVNVVGRQDPDRIWKNFLDPSSFVWAEKSGRPMEDCPRLGSNLGEKPEGNDWDEEDLPKRFPRLWKEFGW